MGHYARNCWAAGNGRPPQQYQLLIVPTVPAAVDDETNEMKIYFRKKMQKQRSEEEKRAKEEERRREEEERREADRLREAEARKAKLEAKLLRLMSQHGKPSYTSVPPLVKKKSPTTKARMLREIHSYLDESEDEGEEGAPLPLCIVSSGGEIWVDRWKVVKGKVGESIIIVRGRNKCLKECRRELENGGSFFVSRIKITSSEVEHRKYVLRDLLRQPWRIRTLYKKKAQELLALYKTAATFGRKTSRYQLKTKITKVIRSVFGIEIRRRPIVRIPYSSSVSTPAIQEMIVDMVGRLITDPHLRAYVAHRTRVLFKKHLTVGQIIHNHRLFAEANKVVCTCEGSTWTRSQGHVKLRLDNVPEAPSFVKNSKNVTCREAMTTDALARCIKEATKPWSKGIYVPIDLRKISACIRQSGRIEARAMTTSKVRKWSDNIQKFVVVPIDRNPDATLIICPVLYLHACNMAFTWNPSFLPVTEVEDDVIKTMKGRYVRTGLQAIAMWGKAGEVGRAYVLPKDKDVNRWRPISPAIRDPARLAVSRIGRAIRFMLFGIGDGRHFDLRSTDDLRKRCGEIQKELTRGGDGALARSYDIKDMFSRLSHDSIINAVKWVIDLHRQRGMVGVRVSQRGRMCMMAKNQWRSEGFILLEFRLVIEAVVFELANTYVKCAGQIMKQEFGIPVRRNSSPALACLVCARAEDYFLSSLGRDVRWVKGMRMIDDVAVIIGLVVEDGETEERAARIFEVFEQCYDDSLNLVRKDSGGNSFEFLGAQVMVESAAGIVIHVFPRTRNQQSLIDTGRLRIQSMQDYESFSKKSTKRSASVPA
ncbi:hypothetical protein CBR_g21096 [Chara braunii]|uniref:Reverse transcriptase domain-containing protein n=1 Tax=Chara braunii TaxID=69332 RepID=A0A388L0U0_CHABU|nr:hypothetical protein CBR_g21096 [Chara braunii]|eukprot:GBG75852.1 hypothetical protein CBR_g21096 [Chara braunii]